MPHNLVCKYITPGNHGKVDERVRSSQTWAAFIVDGCCSKKGGSVAGNDSMLSTSGSSLGVC